MGSQLQQRLNCSENWDAMGCFSRFASQIGQFPGGNRVFILPDKNVSLQQCFDPAVLRVQALLLMVRNSRSFPVAGREEPGYF